MGKNLPAILAEQEKLLRYPAFTRETALTLGLDLLKLAKETYHKAAAIRIIEDGTVRSRLGNPSGQLRYLWWMHSRISGRQFHSLCLCHGIRPGASGRPSDYCRRHSCTVGHNHPQSAEISLLQKHLNELTHVKPE